ncbi:MAG: hypothetical protein KGQ46_13785 [Hyphomicrobiales bacterium]|nr:hypothetical protein [Hyphomicrobiales bacterium]MDE2115065.1 hypothetical protein [Hyphomicrobiales bacterium]
MFDFDALNEAAPDCTKIEVDITAISLEDDEGAFGSITFTVQVQTIHVAFNQCFVQSTLTQYSA